MDLIQAITSTSIRKKTVEIPEFDTPEEKAVFEVRELTIEARIKVRDASFIDTGEKDADGDPKLRYSHDRHNLALIIESTFTPDGQKVFGMPDAMALLLAAPSSYEAALGRLLSAALELRDATPAKVTALKNSSKKSRKPAT